LRAPSQRAAKRRPALCFGLCLPARAWAIGPSGTKGDPSNPILFARSPLSLPLTPLFRSFRSVICNPGRSHWMGMPQITNGGPERARKRTLGERERGDRANTELCRHVRENQTSSNRRDRLILTHTCLPLRRPARHSPGPAPGGANLCDQKKKEPFTFVAVLRVSMMSTKYFLRVNYAQHDGGLYQRTSTKMLGSSRSLGVKFPNPFFPTTVFPKRKYSQK